MTCPKCGHSFNSSSQRVTCHKCGTSWNTGSGSSINGPAIFIVGALVGSLLPVVGFWMMAAGAWKTYEENKS